MIENIRQVDGGYIIESNSGERIFPNFGSLVQWLAKHFDECRIGEDWKP